MRIRRAAALLAAALAGCARSQPPSAPLGRSISPDRSRPFPVAVSPARPPVGDPPGERHGTVPAAVGALEWSVTPEGVASSPQLALRRYALSYVNWRASGLLAHERLLAETSVGAAKLTAEQAAAAPASAAALVANHVANTGSVIAISPGEGNDKGAWVVVTQEHTTGTGPYRGLPAGPHVTVARVRRVRGGWAVSAWNPAS